MINVLSPEISLWGKIIRKHNGKDLWVTMKVVAITNSKHNVTASDLMRSDICEAKRHKNEILTLPLDTLL